MKNPTWRRSHWKCSIKKVFLKISQNWQKNTHVGVFLLIKMKVSSSNVFKTEIPIQVLFCGFCGNLLGMVFLFYRVHSGGSFWMCLFFFYFKFVFLLHSSVKLAVSECLVVELSRTVSIYVLVISFWIFFSAIKSTF